jgi:hypothetical protein
MDNRVQLQETIYFYRAGLPKKGKPYQRRYPGEELSLNTMRTGIAPNFIQSWDACWLRSILRIGERAGLRSWGLTHDGFATDPLGAHKLYSTVIPSAIHRTFDVDALAELWAHWSADLEAERRGSTIGELSGKESARAPLPEPPGVRCRLPDRMASMKAVS